MVHLHGMINNKIHMYLGFDQCWVATELDCNVTHRSKVSYQWDAIKILKENSGGNEGHFSLPVTVGLPTS